MTRVLDASALFAYLEGEEGHEKITKAFTRSIETDKRLLMCSVNWGEVYYVLARKYGLEESAEYMALIDTFPIDIIPADREITRQAAMLKAEHALPYADSFAAALAKLRKGDLITADMDFKKIESEIKIEWI